MEENTSAILFSEAQYFPKYWVLISLGLLKFFELTTEGGSDGLYIKFFPFHLKFKRIAFDEIAKFYTRTYRPIMEYGGWGIRYGFAWPLNANKAYNMSGNKGVQLELKNGKCLLIGTQKPDEFIAVLHNAMGK